MNTQIDAFFLDLLFSFTNEIGERGGSVVECRTPEREVGGSKPTAAVLCPWAKHFTPRKYWLITQEAVAPSRHDLKIVDWDVKPQHKHKNKWNKRTLLFEELCRSDIPQLWFQVNTGIITSRSMLQEIVFEINGTLRRTLPSLAMSVSGLLSMSKSKLTTSGS